MPMAGRQGLPLVAHVVFRFDVGGLENGVVNLINRMPAWRHAVIALTEVVPGFAERVTAPGVQYVSLRKPPGSGWKVLPAFVRELKRLRPDVVHTRNLAALEMQLGTWWAGVPCRIHGEHGRDAHDMDGTVRKYQWLRRAHRPLVDHWVALSRDLENYLLNAVGVPADRVTRICNGVDDRRFSPSGRGRVPLADSPFLDDPGLCLIGTVGRMQTVKAQPLLAQAFVEAIRQCPAMADHARLVLVGDGPLKSECEAVLYAAGLAHLAWLTGERSDIPDVMRSLDVFALPSLAEGISNTTLEAMACGLPVIATNVGGNADLVTSGRHGEIVDPGDVQALAGAIIRWVSDPERRQQAGRAARHEVERRFSLDAMVTSYQALYDSLTHRTVRRAA